VQELHSQLLPALVPARSSLTPLARLALTPPPCSTKELNNYVRVSVGLPEHTDKLLAALRELA